MTELSREQRKAVMMTEFSKHRSTTNRGPWAPLAPADDVVWHCKCGASIPVDDRGHPQAREHVVDMLLDAIERAEADEVVLADHVFIDRPDDSPPYEEDAPR